MAKMNYYGYKQHEPVQLDVPPEQPSLLNKIINYYFRDLGYSVVELCKLLTIDEEDFYQWYSFDTPRLRVVK